MDSKQIEETMCRILGPIADPVIVEIGAYLGEDFETLLGKEMLHILIEPDPRNVVRIPRSSKRRVIQAAIADQSGKQKFYFSDWLPAVDVHCSGSLLKPNMENYHKHVAAMKFTEKEGEEGLVECITLDQLYAGPDIGIDGKVDLLWVDIQGGEAGMIRGGPSALKHTRYLFMEADDVEFYEGEVLRPDLLKMLPPEWKLLEILSGNVLLENEKFERN